MKVKVIFVKDSVNSVDSEQTVDSGDGWELFASVPLPVSAPGVEAGSPSRFGSQFPSRNRDLQSRVALVFVEERSQVVRLDAVDDSEEIRTADAISELTRRLPGGAAATPPRPPAPAENTRTLRSAAGRRGS